MARGQAIFLCLLFVAACGIRFVVACFLVDPQLLGPVGEISNDDVQFHKLALNLVEGNGYRVTPDRPLTSFRAPGFPLLLAGLYALTTAPVAGYLLFAALGAAACVLTYFLASELLTERGARVAGAFAAVYGPHIYLGTQFVSENVYIPCLALGLWLSVRFLRTETSGRSLGLIAAAGLVLGWATLTRPGALLLLPLLLGVLAWNRRGFVALALFALAFLGVIVPWTVRNHQVHGRWILIATNGGSTFWGGNNDLVLNETRHLGYWVSNTRLPDRDKINAAPNEAERDAIEWQLGKDWMRDNVLSLPKLWLFKLARLWWLPDYGSGSRWLRVVTYAPFFLALAAFALRCVWRRDFWTPAWQPLHANMLALLATAVIFCGEPRYRDANVPVLMIYAAVGLMPTWRLGGMTKSES